MSYQQSRIVKLIVSFGDPFHVKSLVAGNDERVVYCLRTFENDVCLPEYEQIKLPSNWYWFIGPAEPEGGGSFREEAQARFPGCYIG